MEYCPSDPTYAFRVNSVDLCFLCSVLRKQLQKFSKHAFKSWLENIEFSQFPRPNRLCFDFIRFQFLFPTEINAVIIIYFYGNLTCQFRSTFLESERD